MLNAANEIAVHSVPRRRLPFLGIAEVIERTLKDLPGVPVRSFESLYEADREARDCWLRKSANAVDVVNR